MPNESPWTAVRRWNNGRIASDVWQPLILALVVFVLGNVVVVAAMAAAWPEIERAYRQLSEQGFSGFSPPLLILLLLPLSGLLLRRLVQSWRQWRRYGRCFLTLDPYPGAIGGQLGGQLTLPVRYRPDLAAGVEINCVEVGSTHNYGLRVNTRRDAVKWRGQAAVQVSSAADGAQVRFVVDIPDRLPASSLDRRGPHVYWVARIQLAGEGYDQSFEIPVFTRPGDARSGLSVRGVDARPTDRSAVVPADTARVSEHAGGLRIEYPSGRNPRVGQVLSTFGMVAVAGAAGLGYGVFTTLVAGRYSPFAALLDFVLASGLLGLGLALMLVGIFLITNRLRIELDDDGLRIERRVFGRTWLRQVPRARIRGFVKEIGAQSGQGAQASIDYRIRVLVDDGAGYVIGDGICGQEHADRLLALFRQHVPVPEALESPLHGHQIPAWARYALMGIKLYGAVIVAATAVAIALEFTAK